MRRAIGTALSWSEQDVSAMLRPGLEIAVNKRDKIAILWSALLLLAIAAAGIYGLSRTYQYDEPPLPKSD